MKIIRSIVLSILAAGSPALADNAPDVLSIDVSNCSDEPKTPACASWVLTLCEWRKDLELCKKVGFDGVVFVDKIPFENGAPNLPPNVMGRVMSDFPTLYKFERDAPRSGEVRKPGVVTLRGDGDEVGNEVRILGVRQVDHRRFEPARAWLTMSQRFQDIVGTHEVMIGPAMPVSLFFRREGSNWFLTSWADDSLGCGYHSPYPGVFAMCKMKISVSVWSSEIPVDTVLTLKRPEWQANDYIRYLLRQRDK